VNIPAHIRANSREGGARSDAYVSSSLVDEVMIQQSTERGFAPDFIGRCRRVGILIVERDVVADALMWPMPVVMTFNLF